MKQIVLGVTIILLVMLKSIKAHTQDMLVFSAVEGTRPVKQIEQILQIAYRKIGFRVEIMELPGKRALLYSQTGNIDGVAFRTMGIEEEYNNLKRIDVAVSVDEMYLFVKRGNEFLVKGWESISNDIVVGYQRGVKFAANNAAKYGIKTLPVTSSSQLFRLLVHGRVDAVIAGSAMGLEFIKEHDSQSIVRLSPPIHTSILYHYLHKKHTSLVPKITAVLKEMDANGELQMIQENTELNQ